MCFMKQKMNGGVGTCAWWKVVDHPLVPILQKIAKRLGTVVFHPHITVGTRLSRLVELPAPDHAILCKFPLRTTHATVHGKSFYAVEFPVDADGHPLPHDAHVSLAYRDRPFTEDDLACIERLVTSLDGSDVIYPVHIQPCLYDCSDVDVSNWRIIPFI